MKNKLLFKGRILFFRTLRFKFTLLNLLFATVLFAQNKNDILTTGTSWTAPAGVTSITVECWGGGGGGGAARKISGSGNVRASGGGGGGYSRKIFTVVPGLSYSYTIGLGGTGGNGSPYNGSTGGSSTFTVGAITITASGGTGGPGINAAGGSNAGSGGSGGTGTNGDFNFSGGDGGTASGRGAGGGGGAGTSANGVAGTNTSAGAGGTGNIRGTGGDSQNGNADGYGGLIYGGGGGGARSNNTTIRVGGDGANGIIRISYCAKPTIASLSDQEICAGVSTSIDASATPNSTVFSEDFENTYADYYVYDSWQQLELLLIPGYSNWYFSTTSPLAGSRSLTLEDSYFGIANSYDYFQDSESICSSRLIDATSYTNLKLNFKWKCVGETNYDYGMVAYSLDGINWYPVDATQYENQSTLQTVSNLALPASLDGQKFYLGFYWVNDDLFGNDPGFMIDDILITGTQNFTYAWTPGTGLSATNIANPTANPSSTQSYNVTVNNGSCTTTQAVNVYVNKIFSPSTGNWNTSANWTPTGIPTSTKCVVVPSGKSVTVDIPSAVAKTVTVASGGKLSITANNALSVTDQFTNSNPSNLVPLTSPQQYYVMIESDGNLLQSNNVANVGDIAARRVVNIQNNQQYNYLISPLINTDLKNNIYEDQTTHVLSNTPFTLYHNEATNKFYNSSGAYIAGRGLALKEPASGTGQINVLYKGVPMNGPLSYTIVNSTPGDSVHGYNLIGNPYPSNLDLISFFNDNNSGSNLDPTFYFWDSQANTRTAQEGDSYGGQAYATFNAVTPPSGGTGTKATGDTGTTVTKVPNQYVKVGQAFMARPLSSSLTVDFKNTQRVSNAATGFFGKQSNATTPFDRYWLNLISPTNIVSNIAVVYFQGGDDAYTKADSRSLLGSDAIYSLVDNEKISINGKNTFANTDVVALGSQHFENGNYTISLSAEKDGVFENGQNIYLKDKQTGIITNLSEGNYTFTATEGESTGRFEIVYKPEIVLATDGTVKENLQVYKDHQDFVVKAKSKKITDVELYDATGRLILKSKQNSTEVRLNAETLSNGVYVLKIMQDNLQTVKKIIK